MGNLRLAVTMRQNHDSLAHRLRGRDQSQSRIVVSDYDVRCRQVTGRRVRYSQIGAADKRFKLAPLSQSHRESRRYQRVAVRNEHLYSGDLGHSTRSLISRQRRRNSVVIVRRCALAPHRLLDRTDR